MDMSAVGRRRRCLKIRVDEQVAAAVLPAAQLPKRQALPQCNAA
jgi:hypothetical protein